MVILRGCICLPLLMMAALTRSLLSRTETSGRPMISMPGIPLIPNTSTCTGNPFTPLTPKLSVLEMISFKVFHAPP